MAPKSPPSAAVRVLSPDEYPASITARQGAFTPDVRFAAIHPRGLYYVDHEGAGHFGAYFLAKRKGSRCKLIGGASSVAAALRRIANHKDELDAPHAPREEGRTGPVSIYALGRRTAGAKTPTQLDAEIAEWLLRNP